MQGLREVVDLSFMPKQFLKTVLDHIWDNIQDLVGIGCLESTKFQGSETFLKPKSVKFADSYPVNSMASDLKNSLVMPANRSRIWAPQIF